MYGRFLSGLAIAMVLAIAIVAISARAHWFYTAIVTQ